MLIADITFSTEGVVVIAGLLSTMAGGTIVIFRLLMNSKDAQIEDIRSQRNSYKGMYDEAIVALELGVNAKRRSEGKPPFRVVAPVVPEHNSPVTDAQQKTADLQTDRAKLTAAVEALGLPPRLLGVPATEAEDKPVEKKKET